MACICKQCQQERDVEEEDKNFPFVYLPTLIRLANHTDCESCKLDWIAFDLKEGTD